MESSLGKELICHQDSGHRIPPARVIDETDQWPPNPRLERLGIRHPYRVEIPTDETSDVSTKAPIEFSRKEGFGFAG